MLSTHEPVMARDMTTSVSVLAPGQTSHPALMYMYKYVQGHDEMLPPRFGPEGTLTRTWGVSSLDDFTVAWIPSTVLLLAVPTAAAFSAVAPSLLAWFSKLEALSSKTCRSTNKRNILYWFCTLPVFQQSVNGCEINVIWSLMMSNTSLTVVYLLLCWFDVYLHVSTCIYS